MTHIPMTTLICTNLPRRVPHRSTFTITLGMYLTIAICIWNITPREVLHQRMRLIIQQATKTIMP